MGQPGKTPDPRTTVMIGIDDAASGAKGEQVEYAKNWKPDPNDTQTVSGVVMAGTTPPYDDEQPHAIIALAEPVEGIRVYDPDEPDNAGFVDLEVGDGLEMSDHGGLGYVNHAEVGEAVIIRCEGSQEVEWAPSSAYIFDSRVMPEETWDNDDYEHADAFRAARENYTGQRTDDRPIDTGTDDEKQDLSTLASDDDDVSFNSDDEPVDLSAGAEAARVYVQGQEGEVEAAELEAFVNQMGDGAAELDDVLFEAGLREENGMVVEA